MKPSFYGVTLTDTKKEAAWTQETETIPVRFQFVSRLTIKQVLLGHDAEKDELNVLEVVTPMWNKEGETQSTPLAILKLGEQQALVSNVEFGKSVTFRLVKGSGPVHIIGLQYVEAKSNPEAFDSDMDDEEEDSDTESDPKKNGGGDSK